MPTSMCVVQKYGMLRIELTVRLNLWPGVAPPRRKSGRLSSKWRDPRHTLGVVKIRSGPNHSAPASMSTSRHPDRVECGLAMACAASAITIGLIDMLVSGGDRKPCSLATGSERQLHLFPLTPRKRGEPALGLEDPFRWEEITSGGTAVDDRTTGSVPGPPAALLTRAGAVESGFARRRKLASWLD